MNEADARAIGAKVHSQIKEKINSGDTKNKTVSILETSPFVQGAKSTAASPKVSGEKKTPIQQILEEATGKEQSQEDAARIVNEIENGTPQTPEATLAQMEANGFSE